MQDYFYDGQLRKYMLQFIRVFGGFTIQKGQTENNDPYYEQVPARYGDLSRNVAHIIKNNSENTLNVVPFIACYINSMDLFKDWGRFPQYEETIPVITKKENSDEAGDSYSLTRYIPVPYLLTMNVDIWTSNTDQKWQILEQILILFNPSINLYTNDNALDWSRLTYIELTNVSWTSRTIPGGADDAIDVATLTFQMPIYINPPVKLQRMNIIHTILAQIHNINSDVDLDTWTIEDIIDEPEQTIVTLENYWLKIEGTKAFLVKANTQESTLESLAIEENEDRQLSWQDYIFDSYGQLRPGISQLRLRVNEDADDTDNEIIGTIEQNEDKDYVLDIDIVSTKPDGTPSTNPDRIYKQGYWRLYI